MVRRPSRHARPRRRKLRTLGLWTLRAGLALVIVWVVGYRLFEEVSGRVIPAAGCRVTGVIDGDTVRLDCPDRSEDRGRLMGFDAPEVFSPGCAAELRRGVAATAFLRREIWAAGEVETRVRGVDRYGRLLIVLRLDGEDVAARMLASGHARVYHGGRREGWCE